ncbi:MAG: WGxxGxxG family protein [Pseudomonadota bacterium]
MPPNSTPSAALGNPGPATTGPVSGPAPGGGGTDAVATPVTPIDTHDHGGFPWGLLGLAGLAGLLGLRRRDDLRNVDTTADRTTGL